MIHPVVAAGDDRDGLSVYSESGVEALGREGTDMIGAKGLDEVWIARAGAVSEASGQEVVAAPVYEGFWADPAHALILTPIDQSSNRLKTLARRIAPLFNDIGP